MTLHWSETFATGVPQIDSQHQRLFEMVNDLEARLKRGEAPERMTVILDELAAYTTRHFGCEETLMDACGCPTACVNKMAHKRFLRLVESRIAEVKAGRPTRELFESLHRDVQDWLTEHIGRIDLKMRDYADAAQAHA